MSLKPCHTTFIYAVDRRITLDGVSYLGNSFRERGKFLFNQLGRIHIKAGQRDIGVGHEHRMGAAGTPTAATYHLPPLLMGKPDIIAACHYQKLRNIGHACASQRQLLEIAHDGFRQAPGMDRTTKNKPFMTRQVDSRRLWIGDTDHLFAEDIGQKQSHRTAVARARESQYHQSMVT